MKEFGEVTVADMMTAREARYMMQQTLLSRYPGSVLVCLTMNIAGPVKNTVQIRRAFEWGKRQIAAVLRAHRVVFDAAISEKTGPEAVFAVMADALEVKRRLCMLEDGCAAGRLLDIDVITGEGEKISRTEVGLPPRKCLLCGQDAPVCARSRTHSAKELFDRANAIIAQHFDGAFARRTAQQAQRALLYEVAVTPKPGLVDRLNAGAHSDMDIFTFIDSACSLGGYFERCCRIGLEHRGKMPQACFDALRVPGLLAEDGMYAATAGVNTHKGAVFSLGIFCAALGMGFDGETSDVHAAFERCAEMTGRRMRQELDAAAAGEARTFGEKAYRQSGVGGVRAEAAQGFPQVCKNGLPMLERCLKAGLSLNDAGLCVLVALMSGTQDTNALRRGGEQAASALQEAALCLREELDAAVQKGTIFADFDSIRQRLTDWDVQLSAARISPGGCADLLALTLLAHFMGQE